MKLFKKRPTHGEVFELGENLYLLCDSINDKIDENRRLDRADMDILSKRITNAFDYIHTSLAAHKLEFHTKKGKK